MWWWTKGHTKAGGRDEATYASSELASTIAKCSTHVGALIPSSGPLPSHPADAVAGYSVTGVELLPAGAACVPAKMPWVQHWNFVWTVDAPNARGHLRGWIDRNGDGTEDDSIETGVTCAGSGPSFECKVNGSAS
jgi:hypothetical protein